MFGGSDESKKNVNVSSVKEENSGVFLVCEKSVINGNVNTSENTVINGTIEGTLNVENAVTIGVKGAVRGPIYAHTLALDGAVTGNVVCKGPVHLSASARLTGNVQCSALVVMEGAYFNGKVVCDVPAAPEVEKEVPQVEPEKQV